MKVEEGKLSTEERNALPDKEFGLPEDRKYPLNDAEHIKSAIRFFNYCPKDKKHILAKNINKALKKNKMKVNVGEENEFSKYIDSAFLNKSISESYEESIPEEYHELMRNYSVDQLYIINTDTDIHKPYLSINQYMFSVTNLYILNKMKTLIDNDVSVKRMIYGPDVDTHLEKLDLLRLSVVDGFGAPFYLPVNREDGSVDFVWMVMYNDKLMYITKSKSDNGIYNVVDIGDDLLDYIVGRQGSPVKYVDAISIDTTDFHPDMLKSVYEAVSINANGDVRLTIGKNKSYMDEYMETHRILIENYKNKNYNAMKTNLAFLFSLIAIIERDKKFKERDPETVKARAFAINDFKTYLSHVQKHEPKFDFVEYYKKSDFDKTIINIPRTTILGIKKLLKAILFDDISITEFFK